MSAWKWKLATAVSSSTALALIGWTALAPDPDPVARAEPVVSKQTVVQPPAGLMRAYPHLADAIRQDPVEALAEELRRTRGASRKCELIETLGKLGGDGAAGALGEVLDRRHPPRVRRCAADALGRLVSPSSTSWLSELVRDPDVSVRSTAIRALAAREDGFARQVLVDLAYDHDALLRREAILALAEVGDPDAVEIIVEDLPSADVDTQVGYVQALRKGRAESAAPALEQLAKQGHASVRPSALEAWAYVAGDAATEKLAVWLDEGPASSRQPVLDALGEIGTDRARAVLRKAARSDESALSTGALAAMAKLEGDDIREVMLEELRAGEPSRLAIAVEYFVERGDASSVPRLADLARTAPPSVAGSALYGLVQLGGPESREALVGVARQPGPLRAEALRSLSRAGVSAHQRCALYERVVRERSADSAIALEMLSREGGEAPQRVLADLVDQGGSTAAYAIHMLASRGDRRSLDSLSRAARSSDPTTRLAAIGALGRSGDAKAVSTLRAATHEDDPRIRHAAYSGLMDLGGEHAERAALELLAGDETDAMQRQWAMQSLQGTRSKRARAELARLARDESVGATALSVLAGVEPETAASLAREAIGSDSHARQVQALGVVGVLDPATANAVVEAGLQSREGNVLSSAVSAAYQVRSPAVEREMLAILQDESIDTWLRRSAAYQIRAWGGSTAEQVKGEIDALLGPQR